MKRPAFLTFGIAILITGTGCGHDSGSKNTANQPTPTPTAQSGTSTAKPKSATMKTQSPTAKSNSGRMFMSNVKFKQGHDDGMRDAKMAMLDFNANHLFNWVHGQDYTKGYDIGWRDGWALKRAMKLKAKRGLQGTTTPAAKMNKTNTSVKTSNGR